MKKIRQISVFIENKPGRLLDVLNTLANNNVNIKALSLADTSDFGIVRLIVNDTDKTLKILKDNMFTISEIYTIACTIEDKPGSLAKILSVLAKNDINIEYMYGFTSPMQKAIMIFKLSKTQKAEEILSKNNVALISQEEIEHI